MTGEQMSKTLAFHVEHYMIAVAEHLMAKGAPISLVHSCGPYTEEDHVFPDVEGTLYFSKRFAEQLDGRGGVDLHWAGTSGWCLSNLDVPDSPNGDARWMGNGLMPEPERVAAFLDTYRLSPEQAGSTERPYYRSEGSDFPALLQRLAAYVPPRDSAGYKARPRFSTARDQAYSRRILDALTPQGKDPIVEVPLRSSELEALLHLLEYAQVSSGGLGPNDFASLLASDLEGRRGGGYDAVERHRSALTEAAARRQRIEAHRRRQQGEGG
ncbi:DUF6292 family protein [Streptomyces sp. 11x1]|uniref:DUF6292 family protein n=1 Tax=Streptomyces sp. 11x1 TaxID=3038642 RepID=UPI00292E2377|nr:DUF6292 family protein [Streptomyces sp. 11x1]WNZ06203.1 DUF6292 family protein [Streptomyces sp. 11x1]